MVPSLHRGSWLQNKQPVSMLVLRYCRRRLRLLCAGDVCVYCVLAAPMHLVKQAEMARCMSQATAESDCTCSTFAPMTFQPFL